MVGKHWRGARLDTELLKSHQGGNGAANALSSQSLGHGGVSIAHGQNPCYLLQKHRLHMPRLDLHTTVAKYGSISTGFCTVAMILGF